MRKTELRYLRRLIVGTTEAYSGVSGGGRYTANSRCALCVHVQTRRASLFTLY